MGIRRFGNNNTVRVLYNNWWTKTRTALTFAESPRTLPVGIERRSLIKNGYFKMHVLREHYNYNRLKRHIIIITSCVFSSRNNVLQFHSDILKCLTVHTGCTTEDLLFAIYPAIIMKLIKFCFF